MGTSSGISLGESLLKRLQQEKEPSLKELAQQNGLSYSCLYQRLQAGTPLGKINYKARLTPEFKAAILEEMKISTHREIAKKHHIGLDTLTKIRKEVQL